MKNINLFVFAIALFLISSCEEEDALPLSTNTDEMLPEHSHVEQLSIKDLMGTEGYHAFEQKAIAIKNRGVALRMVLPRRNMSLPALR